MCIPVLSRSSTLTVSQSTPRATATRARKTTESRAAGDPTDSSSFISVGNTESATGAYAGFTDVRDLRMFLISPQFLKYYVKYDQGWSTNVRVNVALDYIRAVYLQGDTSDEFPLSFADIDKHKPPQDSWAKSMSECDVYEKRQRQKYLAHILIQMVQEFSHAESGSVDATEHANFSAQLKALGKKHLRSVPDIAGKTVTWPKLAPASSKESLLERYNRGWNLLKCMAYNTSTENWPKRFERIKLLEYSKTITPDYVPEFMRQKPIAPAPSKPEAEAHKALARKSFKLTWVRAGYEVALEDYLTENRGRLHLPPATMKGSGDPRIHDSQQYRDTLRLDYQCKDNGLQLRNIIMTLPGGSDKHPREYDIFSCDWDELEAKIALDFEGDIDVAIMLEPLEEGNELMESRRPPSQLEGIFKEVVES